MAPLPLSRYACYDVEVDAAAGRVVRAGEEQHLRDKSLEVLLYLIVQRDRLVPKDELFDRIWSGTVVTDDTLVQCIVDIRRALGDHAREPRFVRTVLKRGYQFIAPVRQLAATSSVSIEIETSSTVNLEVIQETPEAATPLLSRNRVAAASVALGVLSLAAVAYSSLRSHQWTGGPQPGARGLRGPASPVLSPGAAATDALTSDAEALRLYALGLARAEAYRTEEAIDLFERAIVIDPEFAMAHARIGYTRAAIGYERAAALPHLTRALSFPHRLTERDRLLIDAWLAIAETRYPEALERYQLVVSRYPTDVESQRRLAQLLVGEERFDEAIKVLEMARSIDPSNAEIHNALGIYSQVGRHDDSIAARLQYVKLRPLEPNAYDSLGISYHWAGRYEEALEAYGRALEIRPDFDMALYHRAATLVQLGRFREAARDVNECLSRATNQPDVARAWATLSDIHRLEGDQAAMRSAVARVPGVSAWAPMVTHVEAGMVEGTDWSVEIDRHFKFGGRGTRTPRRGDLIVQAYAARRRGEKQRAVELFQRALRFAPQTWYVDSFETSLGDMYFELGRHEEALREYERVLAINARYAKALYGLGRSAEALGRREMATRAFGRFVELWKNADPDARDLVDARRRLARLQG